MLVMCVVKLTATIATGTVNAITAKRKINNVVRLSRTYYNIHVYSSPLNEFCLSDLRDILRAVMCKECVTYFYPLYLLYCPRCLPQRVHVKNCLLRRRHVCSKCDKYMLLIKKND